MNRETLYSIFKNWKNPYFFRNKLLYKLISILYKRIDGHDIFSEIWDNLIILDACRYDYFKEEFDKNKLKGNLKLKISKGSHTISFLLNNFDKDYYDDIIYITANPHVDMLIKTKFFKVISPWRDGWDKNYHTVLPKTMYERTIDTHIKYPNKKLIIHFIQPHFPYIGYRINEDPFKSLKKAVSNKTTIVETSNSINRPLALYSTDFYAMIERNSLINAYRKNLERTIPYLERLIETLPGKTIISADHGEALGEYLHPLIPIRFYGHKDKVNIPYLVNIPWMIVERKKDGNKELENLEERKKILKGIIDLKDKIKL